MADSVQSRQDVLRRLADDASMIIWEADADGRFIYINPQAMQGLARPDELRLSDWFQFIHPDDFPRVSAIVREARETLQEYRIEYRIVRSDGSLRWIMSTAAPRMSQDGRLSGYIGTLTDVSDIHETRVTLALSETEHRLLTENALDMISHSDAENRYLYASPSHKDILGYDPQELIGTSVYSYIHPDDLKPKDDDAPPQRFGLANIRFRHKDGHWVWLGATTRRIRHPQTGEKLGIVSVARDITAQIDTERELARREERFRSLTSLSSDWYWETDADLRFIFFSDGFFSRMGVEPRHLLGTTFRSTAEDEHEPAFVTLLETIAARRSFREVTYSVQSPTHPGVVRFIRVSGEPFFEDGVFRGYRGVTHDVTREVKTTRALQQLATRDALTELPNRSLLETRLQQRLQDRRGHVPQAVFFIDLDDFKEVNDSLGHAAGDALLKEIAARLMQCIRPDDMVARLGGDEFVVVAECEHGSASAAAIAEKLCSVVVSPAMVEGHEVTVGTSVGISIYPQDGETTEILLQNADTALYRAKAAGGKDYRFFAPEMGTAAKARLMLQTALRYALERNELSIHYQPRVNLKTLEVTGMEALLRWTHPEMGPIPPAQFIPLAEEIGLIDEIGGWVLQCATVQAQEWNIRFNLRLRISVNLSARQLRNRKLGSFVSDALRASGLPAHLLELELTETVLMEDPDLAAGLLKELKSLGLYLSVDDFGTGYSSLAYLWKFPLDSVKLDRSFLLERQSEDVSPRELAKAIINLAHTLNLSVVAEGVETAEHLEFLRQTSCDEIQGFCISKPVPPQQFEQFLSQAPQAWRKLSPPAS